MNNITLYRKYRPITFNELYGQEHIKRAIKNALIYDKLSHAYLFNGPRGVGKTTIARLIARTINCLNLNNFEPCGKCENCIAINKGIFPDLIEIDAASNRGIDEIRQLKENTSYLPVMGNKKIYIIDEVHMLTKEAFNALLKILEEPPKHIIFILATTEIEKIPDTVISRTQRYDFKTISEKDIIELLKNISIKENINIDEAALELIYRKSEGSARDAFSIFEQVISNYLTEKIITLEMAEDSLGIISQKSHNDFLNLILENKKEDLINFVDKLWLEGILIDQFLKDFCVFTKNSNIDINKKIHIIKNILEILNIYKFEDDKRLLSYLIIYKLLNFNYYQEKEENQNNVSLNLEIEEKFEIKNDTIDNNMWNKFLKVLKLEGYHALSRVLDNSTINLKSNKLKIFLDKNSPTYSYNKNIAFKQENIEIIENLLKIKFNKKLKIDNSSDEDLIDLNLKNKLIELFDAIEK